MLFRSGDLSTVVRTVEPDERSRAAAERGYRRFLGAYEALSAWHADAAADGGTHDGGAA